MEQNPKQQIRRIINKKVCDVTRVRMNGWAIRDF